MLLSLLREAQQFNKYHFELDAVCRTRFMAAAYMYPDIPTPTSFVYSFNRVRVRVKPYENGISVTR